MIRCLTDHTKLCKLLYLVQINIELRYLWWCGNKKHNCCVNQNRKFSIQFNDKYSLIGTLFFVNDSRWIISSFTKFSFYLVQLHTIGNNVLHI